MTSKREQIIETTCHLMETQGYHATGLNQILTESGAPKGSLYYYFPEGKEELGVEAIERSGHMIEMRIRQMISDIDDPVTAVSNFITALAGHVDASGYMAGGPITAIAVESASTNDRLREACRAAYESWQVAFAEKLAEGGFSAERSRRLAGVIVSALEGGIILSRSRRSPQPILDIAQEIEYLLRCS
ncbi:MAG: TetR/AcrR family transcriptional regulator [Candidatus Promineifilaceae bacterium]|nr:TetR/AcrR family transcriptional regulator [Candidatus Promineifilaceae bacterium]